MSRSAQKKSIYHKFGVFQTGEILIGSPCLYFPQLSWNTANTAKMMYFLGTTFNGTHQYSHVTIFGFKTIILVKLFSKVETNTSGMSTTERRPASDSKGSPSNFDLHSAK